MKPENIPTKTIQDEDIYFYKHNLKQMWRVYALVNQLINQLPILHHKAFRADYTSQSTKIGEPSAARILVP